MKRGLDMTPAEIREYWATFALRWAVLLGVLLGLAGYLLRRTG